MSGSNRLLLSKPSWISRYGFAVLSITAALIISLWLAPLVDIGLASRSGRSLAFPGTLFLCAVMLSASYGGIGPSLLVTTFSTFAFAYYFRHLPEYSKSNEIPRIIMFIVANLLVGFLSAAQRSAKESVQRANEALHAESSERKRTEEVLRQARAELAHANRVNSMGELTATLAHEVNQPIAAAITDANTCLRWLARDQPNLDEARAAASRSIHDATRAAEIVRRVRLLFEKGAPQRELVNLKEVIQEMMLLLHGEATQFAVLVRTELAADLPPVTADRVQLQQVLMNLVMNSIDAMKDVEGRKLTIQSQRIENAQVLVSVSDTGVGLPPQHADKIFDAFFTTKTNGTGMGLQISRSIVESNGGRLWAIDNAPRGAIFYFTLPVSGMTAASVGSGDRAEPLTTLRQQPHR